MIFHERIIDRVSARELKSSAAPLGETKTGKIITLLLDRVITWDQYKMERGEHGKLISNWKHL